MRACAKKGPNIGRRATLYESDVRLLTRHSGAGFRRTLDLGRIRCAILLLPIH